MERDPVPFKRPSKKLLDGMMTALGDVNERLKEMEIVRNGGKSSFWLLLSKKMEHKLTVVESELDSHLKYSNEMRVALLEQRKMFRLFMGLVDDMTHDIPIMERRRTEIQERIRELSQRLGTK
ncbi:MAG: hypothetical protein EKK55_17385 [Rhodocyclaceae bacterium]|nr:MAG: hypothetical protein EKK55_17385 [Rhodocyclaceae bacterium]